MRTKDAVNWPVAQEEQLRQLWDVDGYSSGMIAKVMGRTRNAIIGKVGRMGLKKRKSRVKQYAERRSTNHRIRTPSGFGGLKPQMGTPSAGEVARLKGRAWTLLPDTSPVTLLDLEPGMCKWPIGDDRPYLFCAAPAGHGSYCDIHAAVSRGVGTESERAAHRAREAVPA